MSDIAPRPGPGAGGESAADDPEGRLAAYLARTQTPLDLLALATLWLCVVPPGDFSTHKALALTLRLAISAVYGIDPLIMGLAPAWAIPLAIHRAALTPEQIDVWEVHEAFSAQALGVLRELPNQLDGFTVPDDKLTPNGGAVAIGHPFVSAVG